MEHQTNDKQSLDQLRSEVAEILLGANSPARNIPELKPLIDEYKDLVQRQTELESLEAKIAEVLPIIEQVEADVAEANKQIAAEMKHLISFAGELGRTAFAGLQAGEIPLEVIFAGRKELQARIDSLQQQRTVLLAEEKTTLIEKIKQQAQQLALAGQIKEVLSKVVLWQVRVRWRILLKGQIHNSAAQRWA